MSAASATLRFVVALLATTSLAARGQALPAPAAAAESPVGATVRGDGAQRSVLFRVWAPHAQKVAVIGDFNSWKEDALLKDPRQAGFWLLDTKRARPGDAYQYVIDGQYRRDPRARAVRQEENKALILDPRAAAASLAVGWKMPPRDDLVIYEMHLGTFAYDIPGTDPLFTRAAKRLPYLKALGINCIQLMPVNEFSGDRSWGYNPGDLFAVENAYGGAAGFKSFIKACHSNGVAVLLDIVHNHYGPGDIAVWQFDQRLPETDGGIYFYSDEERAMTEWGPRPDYSRPEVRAFIVDSVRMFTDEYCVDGFRWDSVYNIRYYLNGQRSNADGDRLLAEANEWLHKNHPDVLRIAEDHAFDGGGVGFDAQWNSAFQVSLSALVRGADAQRDLTLFSEELARLDGVSWVNFAECHDSAGDLNSHHRLPTYIDPANPDSLRARTLALLANGIIMTVPGFPMMLQGFEMHDTADFSDNLPVPWARAQSTHSGLVRATADLIHLRRNTKGFTPGLKGEAIALLQTDNDAKVIAYSRQVRNEPRDHAAVVVANFSGAPLKQYGVRFPASGAWFCHYNSGLAAYAKDFDNLGPKPGEGFELPPNQTTLPLDMSRYSLLVFSKSRPPNATLVKAAYAPEIKAAAEETGAGSARVVEDYVEEPLEPFPYIPVPLPAEWHP